MYAVVWEATVGQILPCERKGGNTHDLSAVAVVESNDTPIDNDALVFNENFRSSIVIFNGVEIEEKKVGERQPQGYNRLFPQGYAWTRTNYVARIPLIHLFMLMLIDEV